MNVRMAVVVNFSAIDALVATISGVGTSFDRIQAIQGFGQRPGNEFEFFQLMAGKKVSVAQPSACKRTLKQLHTLRLFGKAFKRHDLNESNRAAFSYEP
jgi:hypothetical protein